MDQIFVKEQPKLKFRFTEEDNSNYLYRDKLALMMSSCHIGAIGVNALKWSGVSGKNQLI